MFRKKGENGRKPPDPVKGNTVDPSIFSPSEGDSEGFVPQIIGFDSSSDLDYIELAPRGANDLTEEYAFLELVGKGGFGSVYKVMERDTGDIYAIKLLDDSKIASSFFNESANAMAVGLRSDHSVRVFEAEKTEEGAYILMEYVDGGSLEKMIKEEYKAPAPGHKEGAEEREAYVRKILRVTADALWGLHEGHNTGIIHRDVKPDNIMLTEDGKAKLTDWGLGLDPSNPVHMRELMDGVVAATPAYISAESAQALQTNFIVNDIEDMGGYDNLLEIFDECIETFVSEIENNQNYSKLKKTFGWALDDMRAPEDIDRMVDMYSMGVTLFEGLTERFPYPKETIKPPKASADNGRYYKDLVKMVLDEDSRIDIQDAASDIPNSLARIVRKLMEKDPEDRYQNAGVAALDIESYLKGMPLSFTSMLNLDNGDVLPRKKWATWIQVNPNWLYTGDEKADRRERTRKLESGELMPEDVAFKARTLEGDKQSLRYREDLLSENQRFSADLDIKGMEDDFELTFYLYSNPQRRNTIGEGYAFTFTPNCTGPQMRIKKHGFTVATFKDLKEDISELKTVIVEKVGNNLQFIAMGEDREIGKVSFNDEWSLSSDNYSRAAIDVKGMDVDIQTPKISIVEEPYGLDAFATADYYFSRREYSTALREFRRLEKRFEGDGDTENELRASFMTGRSLRRISNWLSYEHRKIVKKRYRKKEEVSDEEFVKSAMQSFMEMDPDVNYSPTSTKQADRVYRMATALGSTGKIDDALTYLRNVSTMLMEEAEEIFEDVIEKSKGEDGKVQDHLKKYAVKAKLNKGLIYENEGEQMGMLEEYRDLETWELSDNATLALLHNCTSVYRKLQDNVKRDMATLEDYKKNGGSRTFARETVERIKAGRAIANEFGERALNYLKEEMGSNPEKLFRLYRDLSESDLGNDPYVMERVADDCLEMSGRYVEASMLNPGMKFKVGNQDASDAFNTAYDFYIWKAVDAKERMRGVPA